MRDWSKTCLVGLLIRSILHWENCNRAEALVQFSREKSNESTDQQDRFYHTKNYGGGGTPYMLGDIYVPWFWPPF